MGMVGPKRAYCRSCWANGVYVEEIPDTPDHPPMVRGKWGVYFVTGRRVATGHTKSQAEARSGEIARLIMTSNERYDSHGGVRDGAGRPSLDDGPQDTQVCVRMNQSKKDAMVKCVERVNRWRATVGLSPLGLSTWLRQLGMIEVYKDTNGSSGDAGGPTQANP